MVRLTFAVFSHRDEGGTNLGELVVGGSVAG